MDKFCHITEYVYIFIRKDLSVPQQIVQAGHALFNIGAKFSRDQSPHFVLIDAKNQEELMECWFWLKDESIAHDRFYEPDIDEFTAIATEPISGNKRALFRKFNLYKG